MFGKIAMSAQKQLVRKRADAGLGRRVSEQLMRYRTAVVLLGLAVVWALSVLAYVFDRLLWERLQSGLLILSLVLLITGVRFLWLDYVKPSRQLRSWLLDIHAGDLSSRMSEVEGSGFNVFARDFNSMAHMLETQSHHGIAQLQRHTEHMTDKTRMQERAWIAYELHDSLAQTIGSLRFQARVIDQSLHDGSNLTAQQQLDKLESTLEKANREVRDLISYFHTTSRLGDLERSVDEVISVFRNDNPQTQVFFHKEWPQHALPREFEVQTLKIIQESLANVQKHACATLVRVMMRSVGGGRYRVLIEDNGIGMKTDPSDSEEHIGLNAMRGRAARIGGELSIEGDHGEGVHVTLEFSVKLDDDESGNEKEDL